MVACSARRVFMFTMAPPAVTLLDASPSLAFVPPFSPHKRDSVLREGAVLVEEQQQQQTLRSLLQVPSQPPKIVGHRGALHQYLENTLEGFAYCGQLGVDVELDVFELHDGSIVVFHGGGTDEKPGLLDEYCGRAGSILDLDFSETQTLEFNESFEEFPCPKREIRRGRIPTLLQVLQLIKQFPNTHIKIELKAGSKQLAQKVIELVEATDMQEQCSYSSFDHSRILDVKNIRPQYQTGALFANPVPASYIQQARRVRADEIHLPYDACSQSVCQTIHANGFKSMAWLRGPMGMQSDFVTYADIQSERDAYKLLLQTGVQEICCNQPDVLQKLLLEYA